MKEARTPTQKKSAFYVILFIKNSREINVQQLKAGKWLPGKRLG